MDYDQYIQSDEWKIKRAAALDHARNRCQVCNDGMNLHVHHRTYEDLGNEHIYDLTVLCRECHDLYHDKVKQEAPLPQIPTARRKAEAVVVGALVRHPDLLPVAIEHQLFRLVLDPRARWIIEVLRGDQKKCIDYINTSLESRGRSKEEFFSHCPNKEIATQELKDALARLTDIGRKEKSEQLYEEIKKAERDNNGERPARLAQERLEVKRQYAKARSN